MATKVNPHLAAATVLIRVLGRLRDLHTDMTLLQAQTLLYVAQNPGVTQRKLWDALDTTDSTATRVTAMLSDFGSRSIDGLGLVSVDVNPEDRRERFLNLTAKGRRLMDDITGDLSTIKR